jgi:hypothetical protein
MVGGVCPFEGKQSIEEPLRTVKKTDGEDGE